MPWVEHLLFSRESEFPRPFKFGKIGLLKLQSKTEWAGLGFLLGPGVRGMRNLLLRSLSFVIGVLLRRP